MPTVSMFTPDAPTDYNVAAQQLAQKQRIAQMISQQALQDTPGFSQPVGNGPFARVARENPLIPLLKVAEATGGAYLGNQATQQQGQLAQQYKTAVAGEMNNVVGMMQNGDLAGAGSAALSSQFPEVKQIGTQMLSGQINQAQTMGLLGKLGIQLGGPPGGATGNGASPPGGPVPAGGGPAPVAGGISAPGLVSASGLPPNQIALDIAAGNVPSLKVLADHSFTAAQPVRAGSDLYTKDANGNWTIAPATQASATTATTNRAAVEAYEKATITPFTVEPTGPNDTAHVISVAQALNLQPPGAGFGPAPVTPASTVAASAGLPTASLQGTPQQVMSQIQRIPDPQQRQQVVDAYQRQLMSQTGGAPNASVPGGMPPPQPGASTQPMPASSPVTPSPSLSQPMPAAAPPTQVAGPGGLASGIPLASKLTTDNIADADKEQLLGLQKASAAALEQLPVLNTIQPLLSKPYYNGSLVGLKQGVNQLAQTLGIPLSQEDLEKVSNAQQLQALVTSSIVGPLREKVGALKSGYELDYLTKEVGGLGSDPQALPNIVSRMIDANKRDVQTYQDASNYYKQNNTLGGGFDNWIMQNRTGPLQSAAAGTPGGPPAAPKGRDMGNGFTYIPPSN